MKTRWIIFLGKRPSGATTDSKVDLGMIVRDIDELVVLNDEAHHIHDPQHGVVQVDRGHSQPAVAKRRRAVAAGGRDGDAQAQQWRDLRADRRRLSAGGGDLRRTS